MPALSVIIPFEATEPQLQECLESLARQAVDNAEIILVAVRATAEGGADAVTGGEVGETAEASENGDNGESADPGTGTGPEAGAADAEDFATARSHGQAVAREWDGTSPGGMPVTLLGEAADTHAAARAAGAKHASGEYLAFLPGSDTLPSYALGYLAGSLDTTGSDLATGNVYRFNELGSRQSGDHRRIFTRERRRTHVREHPDLLGDRMLGNKVWRRALWEAVAEFDAADGGAGTDLAVVRAHFAARAVDVLPAPAYLRRDGAARPDLSKEPAMTTRLEAVAALSRDLSGGDRQHFDTAALRRDVWQVLLRLDDAEESARERFLDLVTAYLDAADPAALAAQNPLRRLGYHLVRRRQMARLLETITFAKSVELGKAPVTRRGLNYYMRYPFFEDPAVGVPRDVYRVGPELQVRQKTERVEWRDGALVIAGRLGIPRFPARHRWQQYLRAYLVDSGTGERRRVAVSARLAAEYRLPDVPDAARHDFGGFEIRVDPERLRPTSGEAWWKVELVVFNRGLVRRRTVANPVAGAPQRPPYHRLGRGETWARPDWDPEGELEISVGPVRARLTGYGYSDGGGSDTLELRGELAEPAPDGECTLRLTRLPGTAELEYPLALSGARFHAEIPVSHLLERAVVEGDGELRQERWGVQLSGPGGDICVVVPEEVEPRRRSVRGDAEREVAVERAATGSLRLRAGWSQPAIEEVRWDGQRLVLTGHHSGLGEMDLVFKAQGRQEEHAAACERDGSRLRAVFPASAIETLSGELPLAAGTYELWGRYRGVGGIRGAEGGTDIRAVLAPELLPRLPIRLEAPDRSYEFTALGTGMPVLRVGSDLKPEERGTYAQRQLREAAYPRLRGEPLRDGVLFDSYTGRQCSDSPYGIYAELRSRGGRWADSPMSWLVADGQMNPPADTARVRYQGREFYETLARSRFIVTNSRQPAWFERRPGQVVVQTWHGSMLKRIGFDIDNIRGKTRDYHEKLARETKQWDYLVSPSPWATPILRRAFRFEGEVLETGYPRNDIFFAPERERVAAATRERLGLPEGKQVLLYAPTWRDDKYYTRGKHKLDLNLDLQQMYEELGEDHVLLIRRHPRVVDSVPIVGKDFVYDVSRYPEIMELFLITDILITDYSSMMFDFANTGRPMLFFTYDLDSYRDQLRGFYFDFEQTAPGPLLTRSEEVVASIADIDLTAEKFAERYRGFVHQFCPLDDGGAAARVVDRVFAGA